MQTDGFQGLAAPEWLRTRWGRFGFAVAAFMLSLLLRFALDPWMPGDRILILFVPAVVVTTFLAGIVPGTVTAALSGLAIWYFFLPPYRTFALSIDGSIGLATYVVVMGALLGLFNSLKGTITQLKAERSHSNALAEREKLLAREIRHRTKNILAVVEGIADRTLQGETELSAAREALLGRLAALRRADEHLINPSTEETSLSYLVHSELEPFAGRFDVKGIDVVLDRRTAQNFSLVLHELATNASKYGALSNSVGRIELAWARHDSGLKFVWNEMGGPQVKLPARRGFGTTLIRSALGPAALRYDPAGLVYEVQVSLALASHNEW